MDDWICKRNHVRLRMFFSIISEHKNEIDSILTLFMENALYFLKNKKFRTGK